MFSSSHWWIFAIVWLGASFGSGAALAWLYKRLHPSLAFYKLWAVWTMVLSAAAALIFALGWA